MKKLIILLLCCFLFGCKEYKGVRLCKKNTNDCVVYPNSRYIADVYWRTTKGYCDRNPEGRVSIEDLKNQKAFEVFNCKEYDIYPVWSR